MEGLTPEQFEHAQRVVYETAARYERLAAAGLDPEDFCIPEQKALVALLDRYPGLLYRDQQFFANGDTDVSLQSETAEAHFYVRGTSIEAEVDGAELHYDVEHEVWVVQ